MPEIDVAQYDWLYPFQKQAVTRLAGLPGFGLNRSEGGTGKTRMAIALSQALNCRATLLVCPKTPTTQWRNEIADVLPGSVVYRVSGGKLERQKIYDLAKNEEKPYFLITSYEYARIDHQELKTLEPFDMIHCDEVHRIKAYPQVKGGKVKSGKTHWALANIQAKRRYASTATPLRSSPLDVYGIFSWLQPGLLGNYWAFQTRYVIKNSLGWVLGFRNLDELNKRIEPYSVCYTLEEVGHQLPPLIFKDLEFELSPKERSLYDRLRSEMLLELQEWEINKVGSISSLTNALVKRLRLQDCVNHTELLGDGKESTKLSVLKESLEDELLGDNKALVFCPHTRMLDILKTELRDYNPAIITGQVSDRDAELEKFNHDDTCKIILISTAGGESLNLQRGNILYFYALPASFGEYKQVFWRIKRIGQVRPMRVITLLGAKTVDVRMKKLLTKKEAMHEEIFTPNEWKELIQ